MVEKDDKRLSFLPLEQAAKAKGNVFAYHDYNWCVCPERGLILFNGTPQANSNADLSEDLRKRLYPWALCQKIELVLVRN